MMEVWAGQRVQEAEHPDWMKVWAGQRVRETERLAWMKVWEGRCDREEARRRPDPRDMDVPGLSLIHIWAGVKIFSGGSMAMDLTQTSYSTIPSVDIELGDKASDHSQATLNTLADGLLAGINQYFGQS